MTPLAHQITRALLDPIARRRLPDGMEALCTTGLSGAHFFEASAVRPLILDSMAALIKSDAQDDVVDACTLSAGAQYVD